MRRHSALAAAVLLCLALAGPIPSASADHVHPTVTASIELGRRVRDCQSGGLVCGGSRVAIIRWNASCGSGIPPEALEELAVNILGVRPSGRRFDYDRDVFDRPSRLVSSLGMTVEPGLRFVGRWP